MKGIVLTATGEAVETPQPDHLLTLLNNSPVRDFKGFGKLCEQYERLKVEDPPSSPEDERSPLNFEPSPSVPPSRLRKPSIVTLRPLFPSLASCPSDVPTLSNRKASTELAHEPSHSAPLPHEKPSSSAASNEAKARADVDEDELPSPFLKRVERAARAGFKPNRRTSAEASKALRTAAAANASGKAALSKASIAPSSTRITAGRISRSPDSMR